jgi:hypothetical protein
MSVSSSVLFHTIDKNQCIGSFTGKILGRRKRGTAHTDRFIQNETCKTTTIAVRVANQQTVRLRQKSGKISANATITLVFAVGDVNRK